MEHYLFRPLNFRVFLLGVLGCVCVCAYTYLYTYIHAHKVMFIVLRVGLRRLFFVEGGLGAH